MYAPWVCGFAWSNMVYGCMMYTEHAETAAVSRGTSHASTVSTPLRWIFKNMLQKASHSCRITCECMETTWEQRIVLYKSNQQQQVQKSHCHLVVWCPEVPMFLDVQMSHCHLMSWCPEVHLSLDVPLSLDVLMSNYYFMPSQVPVLRHG